MMKTKVHIFRGPLFEIVGKNKIIIQTENNPRVIDVVNLLVKKYGTSFRDFVLNPTTNEIKSYIVIALNGVHIGCLNGIETIIEDGNELLIMSATGGG